MTKKEQIIGMLKQGKTINEICKEMPELYNSNVYNIKKQWLRDKRLAELELKVNK